MRVSDPVRRPTPAGVKETPTVQRPPGGMLTLQVFDWLNSPLMAALVNVKGAEPLFVTVTVCAGLVEPTI